MERTTVTRLLLGYLAIFVVLIAVLPPVGVVLFGLFFVPVLVVAFCAEVIRLLRSAFHH